MQPIAYALADHHVMPMNEDDKLLLIVRLLAAAAGVVGGGMGGTILIVLLMVFTGSAFGLDTIWPGTIIGAIVGAMVGFLYPRIGKALIAFFAGVRGL